MAQQAVCKSWITVSPVYGLIIPGGNPATVVCTVEINKATAQMLNSGREVLNDILILRLENGRDYYITIKATYARSCFGMAAEELVMYSEPVRNVPLDSIERSKVIDPRASTALCIPKELWRIVDAIYEKGLFVPHLFTEPGTPDEIAQIRESLDTGSRFGEFSVHSYAETLTSFLESLSVSIVPSNLFPSHDVDSLSIQSCARRLLEELPPVHYNIFVYVVSFFREVLAHRQQNLLSAAKIARVCFNSMAAGNDLDSSGASVSKRHGMQLIILHLLETSSI
jgi:phosphatidylinositol-bisphosphatase